MVYPFAMKYVVIIVIIAILVRIDFVLNSIDQLYSKAKSHFTTAPVSKNVESNRELIQTKVEEKKLEGPRSIFFNLLEEFRTVPDKEKRERIIFLIKGNADLLTEKKDSEFEKVIYLYRDLLNQRNLETINLLIDLQNVLRGENLEIVRRFTSILIDLDFNVFVKNYVKSKDTNCIVSSLVADSMNDDEKYTVLYERMESVNLFLSKEQSDVTIKDLATRCQIVLKLQIEKLAPEPQIEESKESLPADTIPPMTPTSP